MVSVTLSPPSDWTLMGSISGLVMRMGGVVSAREWRWSQLTGDLPVPDGSALEKQAPGLPLQAGSRVAPISSTHEIVSFTDPDLFQPAKHPQPIWKTSLYQSNGLKIV